MGSSVRRCTGKKCPSAFQVPSAHLQNAQIVEGFRVRVIVGQGEAKTLMSHVDISKVQANVSQVVPDVSLGFRTLGQTDCSFHARQGKIVLLGEKATESQVVVKFRVVDAHL